MITTTLSIILFIIFFTLGAIHLYWAFGGKWALKTAIPTKKDHENSLFKPSAFATIIVAAALLLFASFYLLKTELLNYKLPALTDFLLWFLPLLFLIRAIGDFKYVGFFKSRKNIKFAKWDTNFFSPLCLAISIVGTIILFLH